MIARFDYGDAVRVIRNIRNDGTYPGVNTGKLLVRSGSVGYVRDIGTFLQDQIIYSVYFIEENGRLVGCREQELVPIDAPSVFSRFEVRDKVISGMALAIIGKVVVAKGDKGEVMRVVRDSPAGVMYHVLFSERMLLVPESAIELSANP